MRVYCIPEVDARSEGIDKSSLTSLIHNETTFHAQFGDFWYLKEPDAVLPYARVVGNGFTIDALQVVSDYRCCEAFFLIRNGTCHELSIPLRSVQMRAISGMQRMTRADVMLGYWWDRCSCEDYARPGPPDLEKRFRDHLSFNFGVTDPYYKPLKVSRAQDDAARKTSPYGRIQASPAPVEGDLRIRSSEVVRMCAMFPSLESRQTAVVQFVLRDEEAGKDILCAFRLRLLKTYELPVL